MSHSDITITPEQLPNLLKDYPEALKRIQALPNLDTILRDLPEPPEMGMVSDEEQQMAMLTDLWRRHFMGMPPWVKR